MQETIFATRDACDDLEEGDIFAPKFDNSGLLPAVVTDAATGELLMVAYMNAEALARTIETGEAHYWSRSRGKLWRKGETSGNTQQVVEMLTDCDQDTIWLKVSMEGTGACCHTGRKSCFYRNIPVGTADPSQARLSIVDDDRLFDPKEVYGARSSD